MGPSRIMLLRHAEKPGTYQGSKYAGVNALGAADDESLVTLGWQRAGGIAELFTGAQGLPTRAGLALPDFLYAANPADHHDNEPSQRPYQTIAALAAKLGRPVNCDFRKNDYPALVSALLALALPNATSCSVLVAWQHQDILPKSSGADCILKELLQQTGTDPAQLPDLPSGPWPEDRYDMVLVLERPTGSGPFIAFRQVPQLLLAGDSRQPL